MLRQTAKGRGVSHAFYVGQRIVCVDDCDVDDTGTSVCIRYLKRGRTYTVARTYVLPSGRGVNLEEIDRPYSYEGFRSERFRPALEHDEDVSIFARALAKRPREIV